MAKEHDHSAWCDHFPPSKIRWFHETIEDWYDAPTARGFGPRGTRYGHFDLLREMIWSRSAADTEALDYCHKRTVLDGARSASGLWCVCLNEDAPATVSGRGHVGGDGMSALVTTKTALEYAADQLPISWSTTQLIFEAQGRNLLYQGRFLTYRQNLRVREIDRWSEPRDPETGRPKSRSLAFWMMSRELKGVRDVCAWPKPGSIVERDVFRARANPAQQLEEIAA